MKTGELTRKQRRFVLEYQKDLCATQAAIRAGYSRKTADVQGSRLLGYAKVSTAIRELIAKHAEKAGLTADLVHRRLKNILATNIKDFFSPDGRRLEIHELSSDKADALASCKTLKTNLRSGDGVQEETIELKQWDVPRTAELAGKILGMIKDKPEPTGDREPITVIVQFLQIDANNGTVPSEAAISVSAEPL